MLYKQTMGFSDLFDHSSTLRVSLFSKAKALLLITLLLMSLQSRAVHAATDQQKMAAVMAIINMYLMETGIFDLQLGVTESETVQVSPTFEARFDAVPQDVEVCFVVSSLTPYSNGDLSLTINGQLQQGNNLVTLGENCYTVPQSQQLPENILLFEAGQGVNVTLSLVSLEPSQASRLGLSSLSRSGWDEKAVRKVLTVFAFGGHATDQQIRLWSNMNPNVAIAEMLNFSEHNLKLSPVSSTERYRQTATQYGEFTDFVTNFLSSPASDSPIEVGRREKYAPDGYAFDDAISYMITMRGLNPFRQMVGFWETNYHLAVNLDSNVNNNDMMAFYDLIMNAHESGVPYQRVLAEAAKATAPAEQYGHNDNEWINGTCFCNDDFAREIHQLYFGIFGEGDEEHHENVTIPNTAAMLTGMRTYDRIGNDYERRYDIRQDLAVHHLPALNILRQTIAGSGPLAKIDTLVEYSIEHPESLENLPIMIISGIADDNLNETRKNQLRAAWASMGSNKNFLEFIRAYAISDLFHGPDHFKYMNSFWRTYNMVNRFNLENVEALLAGRDGRLGRPVNSILDNDDVQEFRPTNNVFGGQTSLEASDSARIFEEYYNRSTGNSYQWNWVECDDCDQGNAWQKNWGLTIPAINGQHRTDDVARWLWNHLVGNLDNYTELERAHLVSILGATTGGSQNQHFDLSIFLCFYNDRREQGQTLNTAAELMRRSYAYCRQDSNDQYSVNEQRWLEKGYSTAEIVNAQPSSSGPYNPAIQDGAIPSIVNQLGAINMPLLSNDDDLRRNANRRIHYAIAYISATPFISVVGGE